MREPWEPQKHLVPAGSFMEGPRGRSSGLYLGFSRPSPTSVDFERDIYPKELEQREDITTSRVELRKHPTFP